MGLIVEIATHLTLALTTVPVVAFVMLAFFGAHESIWCTTDTTVRQRAIPIELQGRVGSVYMLALMGGLVIGAALGGAIARTWGITAPFWFAFVGSLLILAWIWRRLDGIVAPK
jgi:predicted MFS family arabinose efflux permease